MTLGEKIYRLRIEKGWSQEAFGETLGVSRQSVSKWETDQSVPELDKIVAISNLFTVSTDYLLKETEERREAQRDIYTGSYQSDTHNEVEYDTMQKSHILVQRQSFHYEYKSKKTIGGLPLVHVNIGLKPVRAKGIIAIGDVAQGVIAIGIVGLGVITFAPVGIGLLLAIGAVAAGGLAFGSLAVGIVAGGAVCIGLFSMGALAIGQFSFGAFAIGQQIAIGDVAHGNIALGFSQASGSIYEEIRAADGSFDYQSMVRVIDVHVAGYWSVFTGWMKTILWMMAGM